jgi:hypothetical protein
VSHEIIRPTPRRAGLAASGASPTRGSASPARGPGGSASPTRGLIGTPSPAYIVSVGGAGLPKYSPYNRCVSIYVALILWKNVFVTKMLTFGLTTIHFSPVFVLSPCCVFSENVTIDIWHSHEQKTAVVLLVGLYCISHSKEDPIYITRNATAQPRFQFYVTVYLFAAAKSADRSWKHINRLQIHECRNWERSRAVSFLRIFVSNFRYSVFAVPSVPASYIITTTFLDAVVTLWYW